jgi:hypothetical protein
MIQWFKMLLLTINTLAPHGQMVERRRAFRHDIRKKSRRRWNMVRFANILAECAE